MGLEKFVRGAKRPKGKGGDVGEGRGEGGGVGGPDPDMRPPPDPPGGFPLKGGPTAHPTPESDPPSDPPPPKRPTTLTLPKHRPAEQYSRLRVTELRSMGYELTPGLGAVLMGLSWQHEAAHDARRRAAEAADPTGDDYDPKEARAEMTLALKLTESARRAEKEWWDLVRAEAGRGLVR